MGEIDNFQNYIMDIEKSSEIDYINLKKNVYREINKSQFNLLNLKGFTLAFTFSLTFILLFFFINNTNNTVTDEIDIVIKAIDQNIMDLTVESDFSDFEEVGIVGQNL